MPCTYTLKNDYFKNIFEFKLKGIQDSMQYLYRNQCHNICENCLLDLKNNTLLCKRCTILISLKKKIYCTREFNLCTCGKICISNLKNFKKLLMNVQNI